MIRYCASARGEEGGLEMRRKYLHILYKRTCSVSLLGAEVEVEVDDT